MSDDWGGNLPIVVQTAVQRLTNAVRINDPGRISFTLNQPAGAAQTVTIRDNSNGNVSTLNLEQFGQVLMDLNLETRRDVMGVMAHSHRNVLTAVRPHVNSGPLDTLNAALNGSLPMEVLRPYQELQQYRDFQQVAREYMRGISALERTHNITPGPYEPTPEYANVRVNAALGRATEEERRQMREILVRRDGFHDRRLAMENHINRDRRSQGRTDDVNFNPINGAVWQMAAMLEWAPGGNNAPALPHGLPPAQGINPDIPRGIRP